MSGLMEPLMGADVVGDVIPVAGSGHRPPALHHRDAWTVGHAVPRLPATHTLGRLTSIPGPPGNGTPHDPFCDQATHLPTFMTSPCGREGEDGPDTHHWGVG